MARLTLIVFSLVFVGSSYFDFVEALPAVDLIPAELSSLSSHEVTSNEQSAAGKRRRRRRQVPLVPPYIYENGSIRPVLPVTMDRLGSEKSFKELQDEIFENLQVVAHDMASELSMHLGLGPHTLEAVVTHEEDAPSVPEVLETIAKRFHAPKMLLAGLHALAERNRYFEDYYDSEEEERAPIIIESTRPAL